MSAGPPVRMVWVYDGALEGALDAATWLNTAAALRRSGWDVTLLVAGRPGFRQIRGVEVLCLWEPHIYLLRHILYHLGVLRELIRRLPNTDVILFHETSAPWLLPLRLLRRGGSGHRPLLIMDSRSLPMPPAQGESLRGRLRRAAHEQMARLGNYAADGRTAITARLAEAIDIPRDRLLGTWPSGADADLFGRHRGDRCWPAPGEPVRLVYHGALHTERNLMAACRAVTLANERGCRLEFLLIGEGTEEQALREYARASHGAIQVLHSVAFEKMPGLLTQVHAGFIPFPDEDKFRVSSPIKLFEYLASGLPVVATRIPCHTDVIGSGQYVFWAQDATEQGLLDALLQLWAGRQELERMGQLAAQAAPYWTWEASAAKLRAAISSALSGGPAEQLRTAGVPDGS